MTTNYHTPHAFGAPLTSAEVNAPLGLLDVAISTTKGEVFNVKDYGAVGDGVTDDTAAIQSAADTAPAGSTVMFPPGVFLVKSAITWTKTLHWRGRGTTIKADTAGMNAWFDGQAGSNFTTIDGLIFDSNDLAWSILSLKGNDCIVSNCIFKNYADATGGNLRTTDYAIRIDGGSRCKIVNNTIRDFGYAAPAAPSGSVLVAAIRVNSTAASFGTVISGNTIYRVGPAIIASGQQVNIVGNNITDTVDNGVYIIADGGAYWTSDVVIADNTLTDVQEGIVLQGGDSTDWLSGVSITGNVLKDWTNNAISFAKRVKNVVVSGNLMTQTVGHHSFITLHLGEEATALTESVQITDNVMVGLAYYSAVWVQHCTDVVIQDNLIDVTMDSAGKFLVRYHGDTIRGVVRGNTMKSATAGTVAYTVRNGTATACRFEDNVLVNAVVQTGNAGGGTVYSRQTLDADLANVNTMPVNSVLFGSAAPTGGPWLRGDIIYNTAPSASGTIGWVCVTAGTPGTWKTFGAISA